MTIQAEIENHLETSERLLNHAYEQFEANDLVQASEKAWGAVAHYLKSEAKFRGWANSSHYDLSDIVRDLAYVTNDASRIEELYDGVNKLHINFYEDQLEDWEVVDGIDFARELISMLERDARATIRERPSERRRRRRST